MISLVLGGARSGKSEVAERLAERRRLGSTRRRTDCTYVATGIPGGDRDFEERIARHLARRPAHWATVEVPRGEPLSQWLGNGDIVLLDSLGTWVAGHDGFEVDVADLLGALEKRRTARRPTVLVSDEVGLGVHPATPAGVAFRDVVGEVNRSVGAIADDVRLVVAGRVLVMPGEEV